MSISSFYILDKKGNILISRNYKSDIYEEVVDNFLRQQMKQTSKTYTPFLVDEENEVVFTFQQHKNIIFLLISDRNENTLILIEFLSNFIQLLIGYFKEVEEESIKDNFIIIYELLDEIIDNGYIQNCDINYLKDYIKTDYHELVKQTNKPTDLITGPQVGEKISWRKKGITHSENELFLDIFEKILFISDLAGNVTKSEIKGVVQANSKLSGMPVVQMGLNEKNALQSAGLDDQLGIEFSDVKFHKCVDLETFDEQSNIIFTPPDGKFQLMTYYIKTKVQPLFSINIETIAQTKSMGEYTLTLMSNYKSKSVANDVKVKIPVPCDAINVTFKSKENKIEYTAENNCIQWDIPYLQGEEIVFLEYKYRLPTLVSPNRDDFKNEPIEVEFVIPYFTISGLNVRFMKIMDDLGYEGTPWVRYVTESSEYQIRK